MPQYGWFCTGPRNLSSSLGFVCRLFDQVPHEFIGPPSHHVVHAMGAPLQASHQSLSLSLLHGIFFRH